MKKTNSIAVSVLLAGLLGLSAGGFLGSQTRFVSGEETEEPVTQETQDTGESEELPESLTVICYGDSNTWGYDPETQARYPYEKRWTTLLAEALGTGYDVIPEGLDGRTTAFDPDETRTWQNGLTHLAPTLATDNPVEFLVIMLGTEDCRKSLNVTPEESAAGLDQLITSAENNCRDIQHDIPTIIVVSPPVILDQFEITIPEIEFDASSAEKSAQLERLYEEVAKAHNCVFVNPDDSVEVSAADNVHLSEEGHKALAELLTQVIFEHTPEFESGE